MGKSILLLALLTIHTWAQAQVPPKIRGTIKGVIIDSTTTGKQPLSEATVSLTPESDTTNNEFVITDKRGAFQFKNLPPDKYTLLITFEGFHHIRKTLRIDETNKDIDLNNLYMQKASDLLQEVVVQSPPMRIRKDTIEYNAASFATKPNAVAEDQLKKLPGVQVDASGNITAQGEKVSRILVNGKRFFGDDPKLATRNLPPDIIEKYEIFDDLDDQSKFSGFDNGNRVKTINIVTRRDRRQGYFGRAIAGGGTNETYNESANFHRFNNNQQISFVGEGNNINKQNFTAQDVLGSSGSRRGSGRGPSPSTNGSGAGVTTVWAAGLNYRDSLGKKGEIYGSYFYNFTHVSNSSQSLTEKFFNQAEDTSNTTNRNQYGYQRSTNQRANLNIEEKLDNLTSLVFRPNIAFQTSKPNSAATSSTTDQLNSPVSTSDGTTSSTTHGFNINGSNITLRHKFKKPYRTLSLDLNGTVNVNNGDGYNNSLNNFYRLDSTQNLRQYYNDSLNSITLSPTLSYTEPISKHSIIELNYNHVYTHHTTTNNTYDYTEAAQKYNNYDSLFSNSYKFESNSDRITLNYRLQNTKFNFNAGSGIQFTNYNSLNTTKHIDVSHSYVNLTPAVNFTYSFSHLQQLRFFYSGRTGQPSASQLQPLTTTNDNINYTTGNPALKPQFSHSIRLLYHSYNPATQNVLFATINASTTVNDIQSEITPNNKGGQTTTYVNLNGTYSVSGYFDYGWSLKKPKSNLNLITNIGYNQSQSLVDSVIGTQSVQHDYARNTNLSEAISWTTNIKKNFDMNFSATSNYTIARNSLHPQQNFNYFAQILETEITAYTNSGWLIATNFTYTYTDLRTPGYNASIPLISPSIAKELFKKKNGEIRFSVFDLLHENTSVSKTVSLNRVSTSRSATLQRYAMLTFTYNLNNFSGRNQRRMPGVFPGRFRGNGNRGH
ncbi:MAG: TonB-dependent receptor [Bacteroidetes bacterium]|nr:TonB-dependent receptor [Bacteroidota bacterium]